MFLFSFMALLTSCELINSKLERIEELTHGFVVGGVYWGLEDFQSQYMDLNTTDFAANAELSIYLANATIREELSANPVSRADVFLSTGTVQNFSIPESSDVLGTYSSSSLNGLVYMGGEYATLDITHSQIPHQIGIEVPNAPNFTLPASHTLGDGISIDLSGQGFYEAFVVVVRADDGSITYERRPDDIESLYQFAHPNGVLLTEESEYIETIDIPPSAFPVYNLYAIAVAGIKSSSQEDMVDVNIMLSSFIAGKFRIREFCVPDCNTLEQLLEEYADEIEAAQ